MAAVAPVEQGFPAVGQRLSDVARRVGLQILLDLGDELGPFVLVVLHLRGRILLADSLEFLQFCLGEKFLSPIFFDVFAHLNNLHDFKDFFPMNLAFRLEHLSSLAKGFGRFAKAVYFFLDRLDLNLQ